MSKIFWSPGLEQLEPYTPGEQPESKTLIKLNTNENPYPASPQALGLLKQYDFSDALRRYPDPESRELRRAIADKHKLTPEQVFVGNGSDEVLALSFYSFFRRREPLLFPDITYSFYPVYCQLFDIESRKIPLARDFSVQLQDYSAPAAGVIIPNPNAPTGRYLPLDEIEALLECQPQRVVIVDEAYIDFGGDSAITLINRYPNLLVIHTLSKSYALAGLRLGFAMGQKHLIQGLLRAKNSFNSYPIDAVAQRVATAAIRDTAWHADNCGKVIATRKRCEQTLAEIGFEVVPSQANFLLVKPPQPGAEAFNQALRKRDILVRYFNQPRISEYLRISIGTDAEMDQLIRNCKEILASQS
ncbi:histidinol-phosphate transaminase [Microbulbifer sp. OS29]|uniref:Histidinol-phosphate aminotransferase n=1 Tax=Microbulbifer okhotskensis TaxID=2926617 RepID=A0A9X2EPX4_9GAMM|nr:histidinol-phosphate transaminase [Microbulbifer okhotskensis]MCO1333578.1 histidinol-phosphate transaminase [Microbulbifer okhotskensis]